MAVIYKHRNLAVQGMIAFALGLNIGTVNAAKPQERGGIVANKGLYYNIHQKQERIKHGSGEHMRKVGSKGAPTAKDFKESAKTAKKTRRENIEHAMKDM
jgi:hypothetical protein